ncbi:MAG TPA: AbrB/MazE/SpoVT family DNA-binding domain-containing protein [Pyrinomonadaceae bacterium]|jgi:antitoxin MazE|nr:AbrB/MazE/SpoVT family DNA-binding domain-containing protein [Pyrinomonadaceae bacterium]
MKAQIIKIGNSHGIRIPKAVLEETRMSGDVEIEVTPDGILIRNINKPRSNWDAMFKALSDRDDDLALNRTSTGFEKKDWQW